MLCLCSPVQPWCCTDFKLSQQSKSRNSRLKFLSPNVPVSRAVALSGFMFVVCCIFLAFQTRLFFSSTMKSLPFLYCCSQEKCVFISKLGLTCKSWLLGVLIQVILKVWVFLSLDSYKNIISTLGP